MDAQKPETAALGNWIRSWVQDDGTHDAGAIYGFHNHSVWGGNPYRFHDMTSGHSTWASPFVAGIADAVSRHPDPRAVELLRRLVQFQTDSFQENGYYAHIGFQVGETLNFGLIHNAITNVSLGAAALNASESLGDAGVDSIRKAFARNEICHGRPDEHATCNQDYARIWAKLLLFEYAGDRTRYDSVREDIDYMIEHFHISGFPDGECTATYRARSIGDAVEPAEYYGLMIAPLVAAARIYGEQRYLEEARAIARHVIRSSWTDGTGAMRFHRLWYHDGAGWKVNNEPMLIAGMGDTLAGILDLFEIDGDPEFGDFLSACDQTYASYQHPRGFFASATGWQSEVDVAPSSAWHAHDFRYLVRRTTIDVQFWDRFFDDDTPFHNGTPAVLLGDQCYWVERGAHWAIADYFWQDVYKLRGRKDRSTFGRDLEWIGGPRALPAELRFPDLPQFRNTEHGIDLVSRDLPHAPIVRSIASRSAT